eukprot:15245074-Alexandrium_andersonii.AAC.1
MGFPEGPTEPSLAPWASWGCDLPGGEDLGQNGQSWPACPATPRVFRPMSWTARAHSGDHHGSSRT